MRSHRAITRGVGRSLGDCALTFLEREPIHLGDAAAQHRAYRAALQEAGLSVEVLPPEHDLPDAVFVEDTAVVLDEVAILARPRSAVRRREVPAVARALERHRPLARIEAPARLEGGDVLRVGRRLFVGLSSRTDEQGYVQLARLAEPYGYRVEPVKVHGCLHLKTAVTALDEESLLIHDDWIEADALTGLRRIRVHESEPFAACSLALGGVIHLSARGQRTRELLDRRGYRTRAVSITEFEKAEAGLTCLSLVLG